MNGRRRGSRRPSNLSRSRVSEQKFELKTWADAEVTPGPVRLAMMEAERKKAEREAKEQGVKPAEENKK